MNTPYPPPAANHRSPARKLWPWALGGCLLALLLALVLLVGVIWLGLRGMDAASRTVVGQIPGVEQAFGTITDTRVDFGAMGTAEVGTVVLRITGSQGEGKLTIQTDPLTFTFRSAILTLPDGSTRVLDQAELERLRAAAALLP